ncbi:Por secretion system C-terminal sorting domain-containing protein [Chryseobacterium rhizoplanae]|uniref:Por secretion system C-terminal sorting domain-containing protein n=1 Tax=Chryseobacterium rhizoplanae TaxID=1609531 RepID=A0A521EBQ4_9FLAO|nr:T9SS-dependent M36 family metallopeptidase [Chryseobacterium rhizoplanae]SMO81343.1 Por secretion system C-terminal sorting domain-containing protein [Chryseobacterium rhizoplanae]
MKKIRLSVKLLLFCSLLSAGVISAQKYEQTIKDYVNSAQGSFQRVNPELKAFKIINVDPSKSLNGDVVGIQQTINGIPVFGSSANVLIRDGKVLNFADTFIKNYPSAIKGKESGRKDALVASTIEKLNGLSSVKNIDGKESPIAANAVYFAKGGELILGYQFYVEEKGTGNVWNTIVSTEDGTILYQENTTLSCNFHDESFDHHTGSAQQNISTVFPANITAPNQQNPANFVLVPDNASYNVFAFPTEAPTFGARTLLTNPWDLTASPEGWHSDGTNHYTITRGNNAFAYTDENATNTPQFSPDGGANRAFDFPLDVTAAHTTYTSAAVTNLFYNSNKMHDVFYKFGFTESARNYQVNNFGNGGAGNDPVLAESRDGSGLNNANFNPGADGTSGRMQMFLFSPAGNVRYLYYNSPSTYTARAPIATTANFGPQIMGNPPVTGDLALSTPADACTAVTAGSLIGKIAVVNAAGCGFAVKTKNLQNAGAVGVIQYHPSSNTPVGMGGTDATITIPTIMVGMSEGQFLVNELTNGTVGNATIKTTAVYKDASLDNGVISHEYGHGISNRLTGTGSSCLSYISSNEQMGEGWSDFFALMMTTRPGDTSTIARGVGTFVSGQGTTGLGIRPAKYSPDFAVNDYTYGRTNGMKISTSISGIPVTVPDVHSIGFIWASMLWDLNWKYVDKYGYNSNVLADPNSGSARVLQLVMDALKLQPCNPTFVQGRDAILAADQASTGGQNKCMIWNTFAKRGLGVNASAGALNGLEFGANQPLADMSDQVEDFTVPAECTTLAVKEINDSKGISIYPNPVRNEFTIKTPSDLKLSGITTVSIYDFTGKLISKESINLNKQNTISAEKLINGAYIVKVNNDSIDYSQKIIVSK